MKDEIRRLLDLREQLLKDNENLDADHERIAALLWLTQELDRLYKVEAENAKLREVAEAVRGLCRHLREHTEVTLADALVISGVEAKLDGVP